MFSGNVGIDDVSRRFKPLALADKDRYSRGWRLELSFIATLAHQRGVRDGETRPQILLLLLTRAILGRYTDYTRLGYRVPIFYDW